MIVKRKTTKRPQPAKVNEAKPKPPSIAKSEKPASIPKHKRRLPPSPSSSSGWSSESEPEVIKKHETNTRNAIRRVISSDSEASLSSENGPLLNKREAKVENKSLGD